MALAAEQQGTVGKAAGKAADNLKVSSGKKGNYQTDELTSYTFPHCLGSLKVTTVDLPTPPGENSNAGTPDL